MRTDIANPTDLDEAIWALYVSGAAPDGPVRRAVSTAARRLFPQRAARQYYVANRERRNEYHREHYVANRERRIEYVREYRAANRERLNEYAREYRAANRERINEYARQYRASARAAA